MAVRRQLLLFALVAAVFVFSEAFPLSPVTKLSDRFHSFHRALRRIKRQSSSCMMDKMEANSTRFQSCISLFENGIDPGYLDNSTLHTFCDNNCTGELQDVITRLKRDCGAAGIGNIPDVTELGEFFSQACKHGAKNTYCFEIWNGLFDPQGSITSIQQDYTQCVQQFNPTSFVCPTGCKVVEQWVLTNVGCCYRVPIDYNQPSSLGESYWEICGFKEPTLCMT